MINLPGLPGTEIFLGAGLGELGSGQFLRGKNIVKENDKRNPFLIIVIVINHHRHHHHYHC